MPANPPQSSQRGVRGQSSSRSKKNRDGGIERVSTRPEAAPHAPVMSSPRTGSSSEARGVDDPGLALLLAEIRELREGLACEKRKREEDKKQFDLLQERVDELGAEANDEGDGGEHPKKKQKKSRKKVGRKPVIHLILTKKGVELTKEEKEAKRALRAAVKHEMHTQSGIKSSKKVLLPKPDKASEQVIKGKNCHVPDLSETVTSMMNQYLIEQVVHIVQNDQEKPETRCILDESVVYTRDDLCEFAKAQLRKWRSTYKAQNDPVEEAKQQKLKRKNMRRQRSSQLKQDRYRERRAYRRKFGVNPTCLLETDYMSEFFSQVDSADEVTKSNYKTKLQTAAKLTEAQIKANVPVWERVTKLFRSPELNQVLEV
ncbi:hypothetical protein ACEPAF_3717 [Sanghuangporus sanghuang]